MFVRHNEAIPTTEYGAAMKSINWKDIAEFSGTVAIVGSLIFVGLEIQQSRKIAIADVYQQQAALLIQIQTSLYSPEQRLESIMKDRKGDPLSESDEEIRRIISLPWLTYYENVHFQYETGLISEEHWLSVRNVIRFSMRLPGGREDWDESRTQWRESFAEEVDEIIEEEFGEQ